jgi:hypothetical protein
MDDTEIEERLIDFASEYIHSYLDALNQNFSDTLETLKSSNLIGKYLPLYGRMVGVNCSIAVFVASASLQIFFLDEMNSAIKAWKIDLESSQFNQRWTFDTPEHIRKRQVTELLGVDPRAEIGFLSIPATNPLGLEVDDNNSYKYIAQDAGRNATNAAGTLAQVNLPTILAEVDRASRHQEFAERYAVLVSRTDSPQQRGIDFEQLWREVLTFRGWHPKKFGVSG